MSIYVLGPVSIGSIPNKLTKLSYLKTELNEIDFGDLNKEIN